MHRWIVVALVAMLGATLALPAAAQWKWRDPHGQIQYSDTPPPPSVADKDILQRPGSANAVAQRAAVLAPVASGAASGAPALAPKVVDAELEAKRKKSEQDAADKKKADDARLSATRAENCTRARAQMRTLDSGVRMSRTNEKGEREFLDDNARAQETQRARDAIASECN
jgi:hypothetical protein